MVASFISLLRRGYFYNFSQREARRLALDEESDFLRRSETWSEEEPHGNQSRRLRVLLVHCLADVPFCESLSRTLLRAAIDDHVDPFAVLAQFPVITKQRVIAEGDQLTARNLESMTWYRNQTGGSTGEPVHFLQTRAYFRRGTAQIERNFRSCGFKPGMALACVWGSDRDASDHIGRRARLRDFRPSNVFWVNAFDMCIDEVVLEVGLMGLFRPDIITGSVSSLSLLAQVARDRRGACAAARGPVDSRGAHGRSPIGESPLSPSWTGSSEANGKGPFTRTPNHPGPSSWVGIPGRLTWVGSQVMRFDPRVPPYLNRCRDPRYRLAPQIEPEEIDVRFVGQRPALQFEPPLGWEMRSK